VRAKNAVRALAAGRVAFGVAFLAVPALSGRGWIGETADQPGAQVIIRALGVRDLILGMLTLHVAHRPGVGYRTVATCAAADLVDFGATFAAREHLPPAAATGAMAMAGGAAVSGVALALALRD
jgi:hypothetical protein